MNLILQSCREHGVAFDGDTVLANIIADIVRTTPPRPALAADPTASDNTAGT
jgi:hypothetical protein